METFTPDRTRVGRARAIDRERHPSGTASGYLAGLTLLRHRASVLHSAPSPVRVVIIDDHPVLRAGLRRFLQTDPNIRVVGEADGGREGLAQVAELTPHVVVLDVMMLDMDGIATTTAILQAHPTTAIVALTSTMDPKWVVGMVRAGAIGYLPKLTRPADLCRAIHGAAMGQVQLAPEAAQVLMLEMAAPAQPESLSPRELEVARLLVTGKTNKAIGNALCIAEKTVKTHMSNIIAKMGVESRTQAALLVVERGLVSMYEESLAS